MIRNKEKGLFSLKLIGDSNQAIINTDHNIETIHPTG